MTKRQYVMWDGMRTRRWYPMWSAAVAWSSKFNIEWVIGLDDCLCDSLQSKFREAVSSVGPSSVLHHPVVKMSNWRTTLSVDIQVFFMYWHVFLTLRCRSLGEWWTDELLSRCTLSGIDWQQPIKIGIHPHHSIIWNSIRIVQFPTSWFTSSATIEWKVVCSKFSNVARQKVGLISIFAFVKKKGMNFSFFTENIFMCRIVQCWYSWLVMRFAICGIDHRARNQQRNWRWMWMDVFFFSCVV